MNEFWLCFVPIFVAVDAIGVLPVFMGLTEELDGKQRRHIIFQSAATAMIVALLFLAVGKALLGMLGITVPDFMVAGGVMLFVISITDMMAVGKKPLTLDPDSLGAVPIGVPLIVGPAVLTTTILMINQFGTTLTVVSTVINILIAAVMFMFSDPLLKLLGKAGSKTVSKLANLILASIAVMIIRKGIVALIAANVVK
jgi:multiple antibiotic resistance protein